MPAAVEIFAGACLKRKREREIERRIEAAFPQKASTQPSNLMRYLGSCMTGLVAPTWTTVVEQPWDDQLCDGLTVCPNIRCVVY